MASRYESLCTSTSWCEERTSDLPSHSEDLNSLVKKHIQTVISSTPSKALAMLEKDATELIAHGMVTLNAKLSGIEDERKLVHRVVEVWGFFWDQVLPYVEGVRFLPCLLHYRH